MPAVSLLARRTGAAVLLALLAGAGTIWIAGPGTNAGAGRAAR
jgi:hypothetical protein